MELNGNIRKMETRGLSADSAEKPGFFDRFFGGDRVLWVIIAILSVASLLVIFSSTASMAYRKAGGDTSHYFFAQLKFIVLGFAAMIAVNLAVMNLLPLPALDGGHVLFLLVNGIAVALFKKEIPSKYLNVINGIGFALLMALMLFVTFHDIVKLL